MNWWEDVTGSNVIASVFANSLAITHSHKHDSHKAEGKKIIINAKNKSKPMQYRLEPHKQEQVWRCLFFFRRSFFIVTFERKEKETTNTEHSVNIH